MCRACDDADERDIQNDIDEAYRRGVISGRRGRNAEIESIHAEVETLRRALSLIARGPDIPYAEEPWSAGIATQALSSKPSQAVSPEREAAILAWGNHVIADAQREAHDG